MFFFGCVCGGGGGGGLTGVIIQQIYPSPSELDRVP